MKHTIVQRSREYDVKHGKTSHKYPEFLKNTPTAHV